MDFHIYLTFLQVKLHNVEFMVYFNAFNYITHDTCATKAKRNIEIDVQNDERATHCSRYNKEEEKSI